MRPGWLCVAHVVELLTSGRWMWRSHRLQDMRSKATRLLNMVHGLMEQIEQGSPAPAPTPLRSALRQPKPTHQHHTNGSGSGSTTTPARSGHTDAPHEGAGEHRGTVRVRGADVGGGAVPGGSAAGSDPLPPPPPPTHSRAPSSEPLDVPSSQDASRGNGSGAKDQVRGVGIRRNR